MRSLFLDRRSTCLRPTSTFNFPSIVPVTRTLKLGRWTHSPSGRSGLPLYAFPPFSILPKVLEKIAQEGADVALVAPFWSQRPWFPKLSLLAGRPRVSLFRRTLSSNLCLVSPIQGWRVFISLFGRFPGEGKAGRPFCQSYRVLIRSS